MQKVVVQDIIRHKMVANHCGVIINEKRIGIDAYDEFNNPFEIKTSTKKNISTARDVGPHTLEQWRKQYWIIARGHNTLQGYIMTHLYIAHPMHLEPFFSKLEKDFIQAIEIYQSILELTECLLAEKEMKLIDSVFKRGITKNDPCIGLRLLKKLTPLDTNDSELAKVQVRQFVEKYPLN